MAQLLHSTERETETRKVVCPGLQQSQPEPPGVRTPSSGLVRGSRLRFTGVSRGQRNRVLSGRTERRLAPCFLGKLRSACLSERPCWTGQVGLWAPTGVLQREAGDLPKIFWKKGCEWVRPGPDTGLHVYWLNPRRKTVVAQVTG